MQWLLSSPFRGQQRPNSDRARKIPCAIQLRFHRLLSTDAGSVVVEDEDKFTTTNPKGSREEEEVVLKIISNLNGLELQ